MPRCCIHSTWERRTGEIVFPSKAQSQLSRKESDALAFLPLSLSPSWQRYPELGRRALLGYGSHRDEGRPTGVVGAVLM